MTIQIGPYFHSGAISNLRLGTLDQDGISTPVLIKSANDAADNDLLKTEYSSLWALRHAMHTTTYKQCIPQAYESYIDGTQTNILEFFPGFLSAKTIREITNGVDARTIVWMWKRLLGLLTWVHGLDYIHGAILPPHLLFYPDNTRRQASDPNIHILRLVDWCHSRPCNEPLLSWCPEYADFYPPEVMEKKNVGPWTDIYMGAKTMLFLLGGDVLSNTFPDSCPAQIATHFQLCLEENWRVRLESSVGSTSCLNNFTSIIHGVFGTPKFHEFILPGI